MCIVFRGTSTVSPAASHVLNSSKRLTNKKDPRVTSCDENDQYSLFYCIVARRAALLNMNCFEQ